MKVSKIEYCECYIIESCSHEIIQFNIKLKVQMLSSKNIDLVILIYINSRISLRIFIY